MEQSFQKGTVLHLASLIDYSEGGIISKQLIKSPAGNITLFSFDKGEGLSEHRAPFDALVQVLEGSANITVNGTLFTVKAGESIECPVYDYSQHNRSKETLHIEPKKIILVEGILLLTDPRVRELLDIKIYVDADADERILRRIIRDVKERGRDLDNIVEQYLTTVKPMHYLYVEPMRNRADIVVNSGMNDVAFDVVRSKIRDLLSE